MRFELGSVARCRKRCSLSLVDKYVRLLCISGCMCVITVCSRRACCNTGSWSNVPSDVLAQMYHTCVAIDQSVNVFSRSHHQFRLTCKSWNRQAGVLLPHFAPHHQVLSVTVCKCCSTFHCKKLIAQHPIASCIACGLYSFATSGLVWPNVTVVQVNVSPN